MAPLNNIGNGASDEKPLPRRPSTSASKPQNVPSTTLHKAVTATPTTALANSPLLSPKANGTLQKRHQRGPSTGSNDTPLTKPRSSAATRRIVTNPSLTTASTPKHANVGATRSKAPNPSTSNTTSDKRHGRSRSTASNVSTVTLRSESPRSVRTFIRRRDTTSNNGNDSTPSNRHYKYPKSASLVTDSHTFGGPSSSSQQRISHRANGRSRDLGLSGRRVRSANASRSASPGGHPNPRIPTPLDMAGSYGSSSRPPHNHPRRGISNASGGDSDYSTGSTTAAAKRNTTTRKNSSNDISYNRRPSQPNHSNTHFPSKSTVTAPTVSSMMRRADQGASTSTPISASTSAASNNNPRQPSPTAGYGGITPSQLRSPTPLYPIATNRQSLPPIPTSVNTPTSVNNTDKRPIRNGLPPISRYQRPQPKVVGNRYQSLEVNRLRTENEQLSAALDSQLQIQEEQQMVVRDLANTVEELQTRIKVSEDYVVEYLETVKSVEEVAEALRNENEALRECLKLYSEDDNEKPGSQNTNKGVDNESDRREMKRELNLLLKNLGEDKFPLASSPFNIKQNGQSDKSNGKLSPKMQADYDLLKEFLERQDIKPNSPISVYPNFDAAEPQNAEIDPPPILSMATDISGPETAALMSGQQQAFPGSGDSSEQSHNGQRNKLPHQRSARRRSSFLLKDFIPPSLPPTASTTNNNVTGCPHTNQNGDPAPSKSKRPQSSILFGANVLPTKSDKEVKGNNDVWSSEVNQSLAAILSPNIASKAPLSRNTSWNKRRPVAGGPRSRSNSQTTPPSKTTDSRPQPLTIPSPGQFTSPPLPPPPPPQTSTSKSKPLANPSQYQALESANGDSDKLMTMLASPIAPYTANSAMTFDSSYSRSNPGCPRCVQLLASLKYLEVDNDYYQEANQRLRDQVEDAVSRHNALVRLFEKERNRRRQKRAQGIIDEARIKAANITEQMYEEEEADDDNDGDEKDSPAGLNGADDEGGNDDIVGDNIDRTVSNDKENAQYVHSPNPKKLNDVNKKTDLEAIKNFGIGVKGIGLID